MNTVSNGGQTGQDSGGRKEIGDYLVETEGFPVLIDNYWKRVPTTFLNLDDAASWSDTYKYFVNEGTTLLKPILLNDKIIQLEAKDGVIPPTADQVGMMISEEKNTIFHYSTFADVALTNTSVVAELAPTGSGFVRLSAGNNLTVGGSSYKAAELYRQGHQIVLSSSSGTTTDIDGTYDVIGSGVAETTLSHAVIDAESTLQVVSNANFSTAGSGYIIDSVAGISNPFTWTGKNSTTELTGCSGIIASSSGERVKEIGVAGSSGFIDIQITEGVSISTGTVTVSAPTSLKLRNLVSLGKGV